MADRSINMNFNGQATGFIGSSGSGVQGIPASSISIDGGGQINTITEWRGGDGEAYQVPVYAYVINGIPKGTLALERGADLINNEPGECMAKFVTIGGEEVEVSVDTKMPDPSQSRSVGANGAQFTWIAEAPADDPYAAVGL
jgi:hypothetical protein